MIGMFQFEVGERICSSGSKNMEFIRVYSGLFDVEMKIKIKPKVLPKSKS